MRAEDHPEALIDRALQGVLDPGAQATLDRHLAACPVCAAQMSLAPRFERELAPQPRDAALDLRALDAAMRRMQESPPVTRRRALPAWFRWAAAAVLVACGVTAGAAVIARRSAPRPTSPPAPAVDRPAARALTPAVETAPPEMPPAPEPPPVKEAPKPARAAAPPAITAAALFEQAEKLRREGHADGAIATYRRLQTRFPETSEARLSFAFAGQLLLKQRRPGEALAQFDRHLKVGGEVGEEALAGRATALEELHRTADAIAAWKSLLARYPGSVYASRARSRLDELTERR